MKTKAPSSEGRFAYEGLDRVIHERARLSVLTSLITNPKGLIFNDLKQLCSLTDGNLSRHLRVLETEKMVEIVKGHDHNRPQTICRITPEAENVPRIPLDARTSSERRGEGKQRKALPRPAARSGAITGLNFFLEVTLQCKVK